MGSGGEIRRFSASLTLPIRPPAYHEAPTVPHVLSLTAVLLAAAPARAQWNITTLDSAGNVGSYTSLRLDSAGLPRISFYDSTNGDLKYATYDGTAWSLSTVDTAGFVDSAGNPWISYNDSFSETLKLATLAPEPSSALLLAGAGAGLLLRRRRA